MRYRLLTYAATAICFFLTIQEKTASDNNEDSERAACGTACDIGNTRSYSVIHELSASDSPSNINGHESYSPPLRPNHSARRTYYGKTSNINFVKSGKTHNRSSVSTLLICPIRFPSGIEEVSHKFIILRKIVI